MAEQAMIEEQVAALEPGWNLAADVLDAWASGFGATETGKTLALAAKDLRQERDKVLNSYVRNIGIFDEITRRATLTKGDTDHDDR